MRECRHCQKQDRKDDRLDKRRTTGHGKSPWSSYGTDVFRRPRMADRGAETCPRLAQARDLGGLDNAPGLIPAPLSTRGANGSAREGASNTPGSLDTKAGQQ